MSAERTGGRTALESVRLNKFIADCGICSRREADSLIDQDLVTVNGEPAQAGMRVTSDDVVRVRGKIIKNSSNRIVVAYYKPVGVTCTDKDPHAKITIKEAFSWPVRLTYAGRLDRDSEGLLLMTNDGNLIDAMMRASAGHEKEYVVRTRRKIMDADLQQLRKGVWLKELDVKTRPCEVKRQGDYVFTITLTQGLNRQIRRMCEAIGHDVKILKRTRVLTVRLGGMKPGEKRQLNNDELKELYAAAGILQAGEE